MCIRDSTKIELLEGVLQDAKLLLVTDRDALLGIISKIDLIEFLAKRPAAVA